LISAGASGSGASLPGIASLSANQAGTSRSGISAGKITITDDAAQRVATGEGALQALMGLNRSVAAEGDTSGRIDNRFEPNAAHATLAVTTAFAASAAPLAAKMVGDVGTAKQDTAQRAAYAYVDLANDAAQRGDTQAAQAYATKAQEEQAIANAWGDNGASRLALHGAAQGLIGGLAGGNAGALSSVSAVVGGNLGQQLGQSLGEEKADKQGLTGTARDSLINTYQQTLAGVGGGVAGLAATGATGQNGMAALASTAQGASTATTVDVLNRQLHPEEKARIKQLASGDATKEARLTAAACALAKCYAEYPENSAVSQPWKSCGVWRWPLPRDRDGRRLWLKFAAFGCA
jgi:hypothetical protein